VVIQAVIADDEPLARQKLRALLNQEPEVEVVGEASSPAEIIHQVRRKSPQVLFLDVCMPTRNGLDVIAELSGDRTVNLPHIIITTAHDEFALRAFEMQAADYLLKPFTADRLHAALRHARDQIRMGPPPMQHDTARSNGQPISRIVFKSRGRILFLPVSEIRWIKAEENYIRISTGTENHLVRQTMTGIEQELDPQMFLRVHRSAIVNLRFIKEVRREAPGDFAVLLDGGHKVAMSRSVHSRIAKLVAQG
jgi:two-component system LytT family response regulator